MIKRDGDVSIGTKAPDFTLLSNDNEPWNLSDNLGKVVVLLFYPQNETLVCNRQLCSVRDNWNSYLETRAEVVGISPGTPTAHDAFAQKLGLPISLLADPDRLITSLYARRPLLPVSLTRGVVIVDAKGIVRNKNVMLRAFRPSDAKLVTDIYAARGDAFTDQYGKLKRKIDPSSAV